MSTQAKPEFVEEELSEQAVHNFLAAHPDFFERHSTLLSSLNLPHASGGAVSLVERQVSVLRQKELKLKRQLKELIAVARENDVLAAKIHELKSNDTHFARLADEYHEVNREIHRLETRVEAGSEEREEELRKERLRLKDEIAAILAKA